jgi:branched-chain amino acid aminotransferase
MMRVWFDDALHEGPLPISPLDRGLTLGDGIFETMLVVNGVVMWRKEHLSRMADAAEWMGIEYPALKIERAIAALTAGTTRHQVLRLTLTRGAGARGIAPSPMPATFYATIDDFDPALQFQSVRMMQALTRRSQWTPSCRFKTLSYMDNVFAAREAAQAGFDDALMFNTKGFLACSTVGNVFLEHDGMLLTPSLASGILPGITRAVVIRLAGELGIKVRQRLIAVEHTSAADGMFLTNSLRYVRAVAQWGEKIYQTPTKMQRAIMDALRRAEDVQIKGELP